ncbi:MAG: hypothetical protein A4E60_01694 [Syntrophorhabdus sp. PtaB.Bin047]|jgi:hypothetical protein|nr:MAG: hypothetical protein A4E60_01694 [Syntrophorhabdus sp. PtaB.Bin047]
MKCPNCNATIPDNTDICPACFSPIVPVAEPVTPPRTSAPVAHPREVEIQPEAPSRSREGHGSTPPSESATTGNVEGRFSRASSKKGLFIGVAGILAVIITVTGYAVLGNRTATSVVAAPTVEEKPTSITDMPPAKAIEASAPEKPAEANPAPVQQEKKTVKRAPKASVPKAQASAPTPKAWTYRPDPQPAPKPQGQKKSGIAGFLDRTLGPEVPVTAPPSAGDARSTGM